MNALVVGGGTMGAGIAQLAAITLTPGPAMIRDENGQLAGYVYVDTATSDIGGYVDQAKSAIAAHLTHARSTSAATTDSASRLGYRRFGYRRYRLGQLWLSGGLGGTRW